MGNTCNKLICADLELNSNQVYKGNSEQPPLSLGSNFKPIAKN